MPDLLAGLAEARRGPRPYLIGFAAEMAGATRSRTAPGQAARKGVRRDRGQRRQQTGIGFSADDNAVTVLFADGARMDVPRASKRAVADRLWTLVVPRLEEMGRPAERLREAPRA